MVIKVPSDEEADWRLLSAGSQAAEEWASDCGAWKKQLMTDVPFVEGESSEYNE